MSIRESIGVGLKTIVVAIGLMIIFLIGATVSGMARSATAAAGAATAGAAAQPANVLLLLFVASLI